jgi:hypothetical protein
MKKFISTEMQQEEEGMNLQRGYKEQSFILLFFFGAIEGKAPNE